MEAVKETPTMLLVSDRLRAAGLGTLEHYLASARKRQKDGIPESTWDDIAFEIRTVTGVRVVRESARMWADRYGLLEAGKPDVEEPAQV